MLAFPGQFSEIFAYQCNIFNEINIWQNSSSKIDTKRMHQQCFVENMIHDTVKELGSSSAALPNTVSNLETWWELAIYNDSTFSLIV